MTAEQNDIVDFDLNDRDVLKVMAFAGTGKTSTLVEYAKARPKTEFLYVAFNKSVQLEAQKKFPKNVTAKTSHSLAWRNFGAKYRHKLISSLKVNTVCDALSVNNYKKVRFAMDAVTAYLVSDDNLISAKHITPMGFEYLKNNSDSDKKGDLKLKMNNLVKMAKDIWKKMADRSDESIGMLHDGYLKIYQLSKPRLNFDCIMLDEAQDTNPVTADFIFMQKCPKILVGDPYQAIYGWRGCKNFLEEIKATEIKYLTKSFRFGQKIADLASLLLQQFRGEKNSIIGSDFYNSEIGDASGKCAVIARTNSGLFREIVENHLSKKIAFVGGINGYRFDLIVDTYWLACGNKEFIRDPYIASFNRYSDLKEFAKEVEDFELTTRCTVVDQYGTRIPDLVKAIRTATVEQDNAEIVFSTCHKAKGLEFDQVRLVDDFESLFGDMGELVSPKDMDPEELNLIYVATTRAQSVLQINKNLHEFIVRMNSSEEPTLHENTAL
jgi:F-box protein 18 (helicase)